MPGFLFKEIIKSLRAPERNPASGYTLIELLVVVLTTFILISSLLSLVLNLLQGNERELSRTEAQREMDAALDFISEDLREAVYVYTGAELDDRPEVSGNDIDGVADNLNIAEGLEPILVFWKPENIDRADLPNCETLVAAEDQQECRGLAIALRTYTLVVYAQDTNPTDTWSGKSQIRRYELAKYEDVSTLERTDGYVDPIAINESSFRNWPYNANGTNLQAAFGGTPTIDRRNAPVLVDFVDEPDPTLSALNCQEEFGDTERGEPGYVEPDDPDFPAPRYLNTPNDVAFDAFFACVRNTGGQSFNQDVIVYLRGNAQGRTAYSEQDKSAPLPLLQTQVITRGVIGRDAN